jgi:peptidoglycan hydrolase-like protein with peptidoglycan-binding domain
MPSLKSRTVSSTLGGALAVAVLASAVPAADAIRPTEGSGGSLPAVSMESVLLAAQLDGPRPSGGTTAGAKGSVKKVEQALKAKGLLKASLVDGSYGTSTISAYSAWQKKLGYSGIGANGLPGKTSLTKLGAGRFRVVSVVSSGPRVTYGGKIIDARTRAMLRAASANIGKSCTLGITQGSYNAGGVAASAGTHDGGGAVDVNIGALCGKGQARVVKELRKVGFAAWHRLPSQGPWEEHIHAIAISDPDLSSGARDQVADYFAGRNGLANNGADDGPKVKKTTFEAYKRSR